MGKRKLHESTYFQCDWTGLPMRTSLCYMPSFKADSKISKQGSYICWEAVIAHATEQRDSGGITDADFLRIQNHVNEVVGCNVGSAPDWRKLEWFSKGKDDEPVFGLLQFLAKCEDVDDTQKSVVVMHANGEVGELLTSTDDQRLNFKSVFNAYVARVSDGLCTCDVQSFVSMRKKVKDREVVVFHVADTTLPYNEKASNAFKIELHGDVLVTQRTKEVCYWDRIRYTDYTLVKFNEKRKREEPRVTGLTPVEYAQSRKEMEGELSAFEGVASSLSALPEDLARASVIVPPDALELSELLDPTGEKRKRQKTSLKLAKLEERMTAQPPSVRVGA